MLTIAKTVNRRRLAKEVYDKRILHRILNVQPRPTVIEDSPEPEPIPKRTLTIHGAAHASTSVSAAWKAAGQSDDEHDAPRASTSKNAATEIIDVSSDSEEESRYEIARPPSKRQRMGTAAGSDTCPAPGGSIERRKLKYSASINEMWIRTSKKFMPALYTSTSTWSFPGVGAGASWVRGILDG